MCPVALEQIMKAKSAIKMSKHTVPIYGVLTGITGFVSILMPNGLTIILFVVSLFCLIGDMINVFYITRRSKRTPSSLESKIE